MRIAILAAGFSPIPPISQGGTEWIAYYQAKGLSEKKHQVILFAGAGTKKNFDVNTIHVEEIEINQKSEPDPSMTEGSRKLRLQMVVSSKVCQRLIDFQDQYDIILNNMGEAVFLPIAKMLNKPLANVMHLNLFPDLTGIFKEFNSNIITISNAQRIGFEDLNYLATVYNCVDTQKYMFNPTPDNYLLMVATIGRHKNQKTAIDVAKKMNLPLVLAGKIRDQDYFEEIKKDIDGRQIKWVGEVRFDEKLKLYQNAKAFLFPINWNEPFGLVMIEAMACGTPVIAFNHGAVSEVVVDGKTGFVVENEDQMVEAVKKIDSISREACRKHVEENFTVEKMVMGYENALSKI